MSIIKDIASSIGTDCGYHIIDKVVFDLKEKKCEVLVTSYLSSDTYKNNKNSVEQTSYSYDISETGIMIEDIISELETMIVGKDKFVEAVQDVTVTKTEPVKEVVEVEDTEPFVVIEPEKI